MRRAIQNVDFTVPRVESISSGMSPGRNITPPVTTREYSFDLPKEDKMRFPDAQLRMVSEGTVTYATQFDKTITEPFCYVYWVYWSRDRKGNAMQTGNNSVTCSDFDNSIAPRLSELIDMQRRQQQ
jgi:hypothetical protein